MKDSSAKRAWRIRIAATMAAAFFGAACLFAGCKIPEVPSPSRCAPSSGADEEEPMRDCGLYRVETKRLFYGDSGYFTNPAVVDYSAVFQNIPHYKTIIRRNLTRNDARYWLLLKKTNDVFQQAVAAVAEEKGYDLVGDVGAVIATDGTDIPNITAKVIEVVK